MALLKFEVDYNFDSIKKLAKIYPELNGRLLALIGKRARTILKEKYLSGQELKYASFGRSKKGQYLLTSDVNKKRNQVKVYSFPLNLFEKGRMLRSGEKEQGRFIITRKLKQQVMSRTSTYISEYENKILNPEIKGLGL